MIPVFFRLFYAAKKGEELISSSTDAAQSVSRDQALRFFLLHYRLKGDISNGRSGRDEGKKYHGRLLVVGEGGTFFRTKLCFAVTRLSVLYGGRLAESTMQQLKCPEISRRSVLWDLLMAPILGAVVVQL